MVLTPSLHGGLQRLQHLLLLFLGNIDSVDLSVVLNLPGIAGGLCGECSGVGVEWVNGWMTLPGD